MKLGALSAQRQDREQHNLVACGRISPKKKRQAKDKAEVSQPWDFVAVCLLESNVALGGVQLLRLNSAHPRPHVPRPNLLPL
jgi:hypothetical protein